MALDDSDDPSLGFLPPAVCLLYEGGQEGVANGTVAIRPLPIKPGSTKSADEGSDDTASQRIHGTSTGDDCGSPPIHLTEEEQALAQSRMLDVCDQFRKGLAYAISYLVISMQMQSGWLGMFYLGTKFTRLAAISRDAIAIEFGELSPYFWDDPSWFPSLAADAHVASLAPPDTPSRSPAPSQLPTHEEFTSPTVVTVHEIFKLPNRLHERLAHELVVPSTVNEVLPQLDKDGIQTLLDFFAAAAFDRLHLPVPGANEAIDWDKLRNCPFHQQLLLLVSQVELQQDSCEQDTWPAGVTPEETPHDTGHTDNGNLDYNIHRVKSDWALQQTHTDKPRRNLEHICLGWLYEIADALEEEERMYECQLQIFQDIGLKLVVVSTAHMDQIIEEHISAMDNHS